MELANFEKQLKLLLLLSENKRTSVTEISETLHLTRRTIYRYIEGFRQAGFIVYKDGMRYGIDHRSPFFTRITDKIHFSEDEALTLNQVLNSVMDNSPQVRHLREKLSSLYDFRVLAQHKVDDRLSRNINAIYDAIKMERTVILRGYDSPNSKEVKDRVVEPFLFLAENNEVRCYEVASGQNKTFKLSRVEKVEMVDLLWSHKDKHVPIFMDLFHFTGEKRYPVKLVMGTLATSLLLEEAPAAEKQITLRKDGKRVLTTEVCNFKGVGRFVMGLFDDIEVLGSPEFKAYLRERAKDLTQKLRE